MPDSQLIRFDRFMENALYGPRGYYTSQRPILGVRGDFTTTPKLTTACLLYTSPSPRD